MRVCLTVRRVKSVRRVRSVAMTRSTMSTMKSVRGVRSIAVTSVGGVRSELFSRWVEFQKVRREHDRWRRPATGTLAGTVAHSLPLGRLSAKRVAVALRVATGDATKRSACVCTRDEGGPGGGAGGGGGGGGGAR